MYLFHICMGSSQVQAQIEQQAHSAVTAGRWRSASPPLICFLMELSNVYSEKARCHDSKMMAPRLFAFYGFLLFPWPSGPGDRSPFHPVGKIEFLITFEENKSSEPSSYRKQVRMILACKGRLNPMFLPETKNSRPQGGPPAASPAQGAGLKRNLSSSCPRSTVICGR